MNTFPVISRITNTSAVKGDFNVRSAKRRRYFYRFAVLKNKEAIPFPTHYIHDWSEELVDTFKRKSPYKGLKNVTDILPLSDAKYIAEMR